MLELGRRRKFSGGGGRLPLDNVDVVVVAMSLVAGWWSAENAHERAFAGRDKCLVSESGRGMAKRIACFCLFAVVRKICGVLNTRNVRGYTNLRHI